jgi:hypothetical protein
MPKEVSSSAVFGRFVSESYSGKHSKTTAREAIKSSKK